MVKLRKLEWAGNGINSKKRILAQQFQNMRVLYNLLIGTVPFFLWAATFFSKKMKLFVSGRTNVFEILRENISKTDSTIWFHCASLGEFEQGLPIMEEIKVLLPNHKLVVSFFSPSGFEVKKNAPIANLVVYLPLDTPGDAKKFVELLQPSMAFFVKYEIWPNHLFELKKNNVPAFLISGLFRPEQVFFQWYGGFMRKALGTFDHIFVQNEISKNLLKEIKINNVSVSGDTRFDRVSRQTEIDNTLGFVEEFKGNSLCIVCGSTWPEDENLLLPYINEAPENVKFIIAPHKIGALKINNFRSKLKKETILFSEKEGEKLAGYSILIIDTVGLLTKVYSYADIAYVGGAAGKTGLHNVLEPAVFGVPVIIGENFGGFPEAGQLKAMGGLFPVGNASECATILNKLETDEVFRTKAGTIALQFIKGNIGATPHIVNHIKGFLKNRVVASQKN